MTLSARVTLFFSIVAVGLVLFLTVVSLYAFRNFSIVSATDHIRTAAEIVRVHLTDSMINGTIDKRENFLHRLMEVDGLVSARVVRSPLVVQQFGAGLKEEVPIDDIDQQVLKDGRPQYRVIETKSDTLMRGTVPFIANSRGSPNCLQCHQVSDGVVLGAVTIEVSIGDLKRNAMLTVTGIIVMVALVSFLGFLFMRRMTRPIVITAANVEVAVQRALRGDFKAEVREAAGGEIGQIAADMNRLLVFLDDGLARIAESVARLTNRTPMPDDNQLKATIDAVNGLTRAARFKQAIEEDETTTEIHQRLTRMLVDEFKVNHYSLYDVVAAKNQMIPVSVDGQMDAPCRWCDPQILVRSEGCRARRTGHVVDGIVDPGICYAFHPPAELPEHRHVCVPIIQSGAVGGILQLIAGPDGVAMLRTQIPYVTVYLREAAPVLETRRLMETLRESSLRDPMTGLNNRRFLEEYVDTLTASVQRRNARLAIMMLDLDYFKMVNDTYGHDAGDEVIKALAKVLRQSVRSSDLIIRFGGEEFLVVLVDTEAGAADQVAEKIRAAVEHLEVRAGSVTLKKTISIGMSDYPGDSETFWQAVKFADIALYQAKEGGRNRVVRFNASMWAADAKY